MWRFRKNNLLVNEKDKLFVHKVHLERLLHAKTTIKNKGPEIPYFMKNKLSKKEILRVKEKKRKYENSLIYSRLIDINNSFSPYSQVFRPKYCPAFDKKKHFFEKIEKMKELNKHNKFLFNRFLNEKSFYPTKLFFRTNDFENYLKGIIKKPFDNPNLKFATFSQFKNNIVKSINYNRCNSSRATRSVLITRNDNDWDVSELGNDIDFSNYTHKKSGFNTIRADARNNSNSIISTNHTSKMRNNLSRCQSAFSYKNRQYL